MIGHTITEGNHLRIGMKQLIAAATIRIEIDRPAVLLIDIGIGVVLEAEIETLTTPMSTTDTNQTIE